MKSVSLGRRMIAAEAGLGWAQLLMLRVDINAAKTSLKSAFRGVGRGLRCRRILQSLDCESGGKLLRQPKLIRDRNKEMQWLAKH